MPAVLQGKPMLKCHEIARIEGSIEMGDVILKQPSISNLRVTNRVHAL